MSKFYFDLAANEGDEGVKFRSFQRGGAYEDVVADYKVDRVPREGLTIPENVPMPVGSAIKSKSQAGNNVIRVNVGVGKPTHYYRGTLNFNALAIAAFKSGNEQPKGERAGVFGTVSDKDGNEMDVGGWVRKDKNGKFYISCSLQEPFKKGDPAPATGAPADDTMDDDIPF